MGTKAELELRGALLETGMVQPLKVETKGGMLSALCREVPGQGQAWLQVVSKLLEEAEISDVELHLCRQYVWKSGQMVFGWHVGIVAKSARAQLRAIEWLSEQAKGFSPSLTPVGVDVSPPANQVPAGGAPEPELEPVRADELERRRRAYESRTGAQPRSLTPLGPEPVPPEGFVPEIKVVFRGQAKNTRGQTVPVIVEEVPLPHAYGDDMNVPNSKGRGAKTVA